MSTCFHSIDYLPSHIKLPRRHAFRYVLIEVISTSRNFGVRFSNPLAHAVTSASVGDPPELSFGQKGDITEADKVLLRKIDKAALLTLKNCMQTVYEDGPRRDMRLW
jgi:alpha-L-rhamnosidase